MARCETCETVCHLEYGIRQWGIVMKVPESRHAPPLSSCMSDWYVVVTLGVQMYQCSCVTCLFLFSPTAPRCLSSCSPWALLVWLPWLEVLLSCMVLLAAGYGEVSLV